jgi:hypothetical protein
MTVVLIVPALLGSVSHAAPQLAWNERGLRRFEYKGVYGIPPTHERPSRHGRGIKVGA